MERERLGINLGGMYVLTGRFATVNVFCSGDEDMYRVIISNYEERQKVIFAHYVNINIDLKK